MLPGKRQGRCGGVREADELEETGEFEETVELSLILRHRDENGT